MGIWRTIWILAVTCVLGFLLAVPLGLAQAAGPAGSPRRPRSSAPSSAARRCCCSCGCSITAWARCSRNIPGSATPDVALSAPSLALWRAGADLSFAGYEGEVMRGAFAGVPRGQLEAARAFGMSRWTLFRRIWLPQAIRQRAADAAGETVLQFKATPLVATITVVDIYAVASRVRQDTFITYEPLLLLAVIYLVMTAILVFLFKRIETRIPARLGRTAMSDTVTLSCDDALTLATAAAIGAGAIPPTAAAIARAAVAAEADGQPNVGLAHLVDYLEALAGGRIDGQAEPEITRPASRRFSFRCPRRRRASGLRPSLRGSRRGGQNFRPRRLRAKEQPTPAGRSAISPPGSPNAAWWRSPPPTGRRCSPARARPGRSTAPTRCRSLRPPRDGPPLVIDQSSSATAFVNIRQAAAEGRRDPARLGTRRSGSPTTDAAPPPKVRCLHSAAGAAPTSR